MMRALRAWALSLGVVVAVGGCGDGKSVGRFPLPTPSFNVIDFGVVLLTATNQGRTFEVIVDGGSALVIVADGGDATDIDIEFVQTPGGQQIVTPSRTDANPLTGGVSPQETGGSVATAVIPSSSGTALVAGTYTFRLASFDSAGVRNAARVELRAIVNRRRDPSVGTLTLNVFFVGTPGLNAANALASRGFETIVDEIRRLFGAIGIVVEPGALVDVGGEPALRLAVLDVLDSTTDRLVPDGNLNRQSDEMDELFRSSAGMDPGGVNLFLVERLFAAPGTTVVSGGNPGPSVLHGTAHSGVVAATLSDLDSRPTADLRVLGREIGFGLARYLGVRPGPGQQVFTPEQAFVLLRNPAVGD